MGIDVDQDPRQSADPTIAFKTLLQQRAAKGAFSANGSDDGAELWQVAAVRISALTEVKLTTVRIKSPRWFLMITPTRTTTTTPTTAKDSGRQRHFYLLDAFIFHN
jgi:hypothetical protein